MIINLSPCVSEATLDVVKSGQKLIVNGELFDFTSMNDGDTLPATAINSDFFLMNVEKEGGELEFTLLYPIPERCSQAQAFPQPLTDVPDGAVRFPPGLPPAIDEIEGEQSSL